MNDSDAIDYYDILIQCNKTRKPYSKKAIEFHIGYPLSYYSAYEALQYYGEKRLQELVNMVFMDTERKIDDYEDIRYFIRNYC